MQADRHHSDRSLSKLCKAKMLYLLARFKVPVDQRGLARCALGGLLLVFGILLTTLPVLNQAIPWLSLRITAAVLSFLLLGTLAYTNLHMWRLVWMWFAVFLAIAVAGLQAPSSLHIAVEVHDPGSLSLERVPGLQEQGAEAWHLDVVTNAILLEAFYSRGESAPMQIEVCGSVPTEYARGEPPAASIAIGTRGSLEDGLMRLPFYIGVKTGVGGERLLVSFLPELDPSSGAGQPVMWSGEAGNDISPKARIIEIPADKSATLGVQKGPIIMLPSDGCYLSIESVPSTAETTFHMIDVASKPTLRYEPVFWPGSWDYFDEHVLLKASLWRVFATTEGLAFQYELRWQSNYVGIDADRYLLLGEGLTVQIENETVDTFDGPFWAVIDLRTRCTQIHIDYEPYITVLQLHRDADCPCPPIRISNASGAASTSMQVQITNSTGQVRLGADRVVAFREYDSLSLEVEDLEFPRMSAPDAKFSVTGISTESKLNGEDLGQSVWDEFPAAVQWVLYGLLTLFWLTPAAYVGNLVFPRTSRGT